MDLVAIYADLRETARQIAATYPPIAFYRDLSPAVICSRDRLATSPLLQALAGFVKEHTRQNLGHGLGHAMQVALDAGAVAATEAALAGCPESETDRLVLLAHCAGLLHDISRRSPDHAVQGAQIAGQRLAQERLLEDADITRVTFAIRYHEAFKPAQPPASLQDHIVSGSLYDADKFRWGPDNFTHTLWKMIEVAPPPLGKFVRLYPRALAVIADIKTTFRTRTGQSYGPQFIDTGLDIGNALLEVIRSRYAHLLS